MESRQSSEPELLLPPPENGPVIPAETTIESTKLRFLRESKEFFEWRWKWLFNIVVLFFVPVLILVPSKFLLWLLLTVTGFIYVSAATCNRKNPINSRSTDKGARELIKLLLALPFLYILGPHWTLLDVHGGYQAPILLNYLFDGDGDHAFSVKPFPTGNFKNIIFIDGLTSTNGHIMASGPGYYFVYNYFCYVVPFFFALHFTYLDYFPFLQSIVINSKVLTTLTTKHWLFLLFPFVVVAFLLGYHLYLFIIHDMWLYYAVGVGSLLFLLITSVIIHIKRRRVIHIHHYQIGAALLIFTPFQNCISAFAQAIAAGLFVEGIARWGMDKTFH